MFSDNEEATIRFIANQEAQKVLAETLKGMATISVSGSNTSSGLIPTNETNNPNAA